MTDQKKSKKIHVETHRADPDQQETFDEQQAPDLQSDLDLQKELEEKDLAYRRALADYQNLKRRTEDDQARFVKLASAGLLTRFLEPLDYLGQAVAHMNDKGLEMIYQQFLRVLSDENVQKLETVGKPFDAETMEAVEGSGDTAQDQNGEIVTQEVRAGYTMNGYLLRPAKVIVGEVQKNTKEGINN